MTKHNELLNQLLKMTQSEEYIKNNWGLAWESYNLGLEHRFKLKKNKINCRNISILIIILYVISNILNTSIFNNYDVSDYILLISGINIILVFFLIIKITSYFDDIKILIDREVEDSDKED